VGVGPKTRLGYIAGVEVIPAAGVLHRQQRQRRPDDLFSYDDTGTCSRGARSRCRISRGTCRWRPGATNRHQRAAVQPLSFYKRGATGRRRRSEPSAASPPSSRIARYLLRRGAQRIITANHGNWTQIAVHAVRSDRHRRRRIQIRRLPPVASRSTPPTPAATCRRQDDRGRPDRLNWPMASTSISRTTRSRGELWRLVGAQLPARRQGQRAAVRVLRGALTQIVGPVSVAIDTKHDELWVANYAITPRSCSRAPPAAMSGRSARSAMRRRTRRRAASPMRRPPRTIRSATRSRPELSQRTENLGVCQVGKPATWLRSG